MSEQRTAEQKLIECPHCLGVGKVKARRAVTPWKDWMQRNELAKKARCGDRWIQIKSGRIAVVVKSYMSGTNGCIGLKHENGRTTSKWLSYFGTEFTPETPPND